MRLSGTVIFLGLIVLDQLTKATSSLTIINHLGAFSLVIPNIINLSLGLIILIALMTWRRHQPLSRHSWMIHHSMVLIGAGGLSNILDRLWHGGVIDFIPIGSAIFNLADLYVFAGATLALIGLISNQHQVK